MSLPTFALPDNTNDDEPDISDDYDVPVNKKTSFNGGLNQYFHTSKNVTTNKNGKEETTIKTTSSSTDSLTLKRKPSESESEPTSIIHPPNNLQLNSKRRKTPTPTPLPPRITRSRSTSSAPLLSQPSTSTTISRSRRQPSSRTTSRASTPSSSSTSLLHDTIPPNLTLLLVGVNPGIMTGVTGFAYAHPSNRFWKFLHSSGITPIRHPPSDTYRLPELYNIGNTNIVERPTRDASVLTKAEMNAGVPVLEAKVAAQRPEAVCLVGKSIWEAVWRVRKGRAIRKEEFRYGWQDEEENMGRGEEWAGSKVFVATTTSGLAATMSMAEKQAVWDELGRWVVRRREEIAAAATGNRAQLEM